VEQFLSVIKLVPVMIAAILLGSWFLAELRKAKKLNKPWWSAYLSIPGILILIALSLPIFIRFFQE
jgi:hypothetical protein